MDNQRHIGECFFNSDNVRVIDCEYCGFAHIDPLPNEETLKVFYDKTFYQNDKPSYLKNSEEDKRWIIHNAELKYKVFETYLPSSSRRVVDIGCGPGYFLDAGVQRGWSVLGLEPSQCVSEYVRSRGLDVITAMFDTKFSSEYQHQFDVVNMSCVLEHMLSPHQIMECALKILKPGGVICISSPNDFNPFQLALVDVQGVDPWWVVPSHHLNYFNFRSLKNLIKAHGFEYKYAEASFPLDLFLLMGDNYLDNVKLGRSLHHKRVAFEMALANTKHDVIRKQLYESLASLGLGRVATVYGQLPTDL